MFPIYRPSLAGREREYVNACLESSWISSRGEFIPRFERHFSEYVNVPHAVTVANGTVALHLALLAIGIAAGDEVIVPTLTYVASANMIAHAGAVPVLVDCRGTDWQIDAEAIRRAITPRTKAIMMVHLYGACGDIDSVIAICRQHGLLLIEDCAEAFGTRYKGRHVGSFGDVATFSFFGNKTITTGEGGMVVSNDREIAARAYHLKTQAVSPVGEYWHDELGFNYRMTNICAAIGLAQLENADAILARKMQVARWYDLYLESQPVDRQLVSEDCQSSWWLYSILVEPAQRDALRRRLADRQIETRPLFPPVHRFPHLQRDDPFPIAEHLSSAGVSLPSYPDLAESDVATICREIAEFFDAGNLKEVPRSALRA